MPHRGAIVLVFFGVAWALNLLAISAHAKNARRAPATNLATIRQFLALPAEEVDLAKIKLTIDRMIDPRIDMGANLKRIEDIAQEIEASLPGSATSAEKLAALRAYLYQPGPWNGGVPYGYDMRDPLGHRIHNKLLPTYLASKKGNCVSMPLLFVILGQRLGIDVTASTAPHHVLVKYRDKTGRWLNIEATSGGHFARDEWIKRQMPTTPEAWASGIFLQPLSKHETMVVMLSTLMEVYFQRQWYDELVELATLALEYYPKSIVSIHHGGAATEQQIRRDCPVVDMGEQYRVDLGRLPPKQRQHCARLFAAERSWYAKVDALGWVARAGQNRNTNTENARRPK